MCTILKFAPSAEPSAQRESCGQRKSAEIVLFPGVRYERNGNEEAGDMQKAKLNRDYLVL